MATTLRMASLPPLDLRVERVTQAVTDQVLGTLARAMGAPVREVGQVDVPAALIAAQPELGHLPPGRAHGSRFQPGFTGRESLAHPVPLNALRFARLAAFYGLGMAKDHQFLYQVLPPPLVISVDHGHFLGDGNWDVTEIRAMSVDADLDEQIENHMTPCPSDLQEVRRGLGNLTDSIIVDAVALPGDDWAITPEERVALAMLLSRRRDSLLVRLEERLR